MKQASHRFQNNTQNKPNIKQNKVVQLTIYPSVCNNKDNSSIAFFAKHDTD